MPKHKVKIRFRHIWTVYYDRSDRGCVTSESFKTEELAWDEVARVLRSWLKDNAFADEAEVVDEIHRLLDAGDIEEARDTYAELVGAYSGRTEHPHTGETRP